MFSPWARDFIRIASVDSAVKWVPGGDNLVKGVQCYELFGGIALKNHTCSCSFWGNFFFMENIFRWMFFVVKVCYGFAMLHSHVGVLWWWLLSDKTAKYWNITLSLGMLVLHNHPANSMISSLSPTSDCCSAHYCQILLCCNYMNAIIVIVFIL